MQNVYFILQYYYNITNIILYLLFKIIDYFIIYYIKYYNGFHKAII